MKLSRNLCFVLIGAALFMGPASLQTDADIIPVLSGTWAGEGKGSCHPPGDTIYPWQLWKGEVTNDGKAFYGKWMDEEGHYGKFKGEIEYISFTTAICKGVWTWDNNPGGISLKPDGKFEMTFAIFHKECKGKWTSKYLSTSKYGYMWGKKVD